jgi:HlyD family secretion protein
VQPGQALPAGAKVLTVLPLEDVYMTVLLPDSQAVHVAVGSEARVVLDGTPEDILPASVFSVSGGSQPKEDEKQATQDKAVSRVKVKIDLRPLAKVENVGPGSPGAVYLRLDSKTPWPDRLPAVDRE